LNVEFDQEIDGESDSTACDSSSDYLISMYCI